jgi:hypothetical protein
MTFTRVLSCALLLASLDGCSLVLDELTITCKDDATDSDCDALNLANHLDGGQDGDCFIYQCRSDGRGCEKRARDYDNDDFPDKRTCSKELSGELDCDDGAPEVKPYGEEICDTEDNDCDDYIDEDALGKALPKFEQTVVGDVIHASYSDQDGALGISLTVAAGENTASEWRLVRQQSEQPSALSSSNSCSDKGGCTFMEMAAAEGDGLMLALAVDGAGCIDGRLRVGARKSGTSMPLGFRGSIADTEQNVLAAGVDRDDRSDCPDSDAPRGARAPALALLATGDALSALGLFRADSQTKPDKPAAMVAIGLRILREQPVVVKGELRTDDLIEASHDAHSEPLDSPGLLGRDTASVHAWNGSTPGYLVGYDSARGVELAFIPKLETLQSALTGMRQMPLEADADARHVALAFDLAVDSADLEPRGLAVAWRSRVGGHDIVRFVRLALSSKTKAPFTKLGTILDLPASRTISDGPSITYAPSGFKTRTNTPGGWFITWVERGGSKQQLVGVRIDEDSGQTFEKAFVLAERTEIQYPFAYTWLSPSGDPGLGYAFVSKPNPSQLNIGSLSCASSQ